MLVEAVKSIIYPILKPGVTFSEILFFLLQQLDRDIRNSDSMNVFKLPLFKIC